MLNPLQFNTVPKMCCMLQGYFLQLDICTIYIYIYIFMVTKKEGQIVDRGEGAERVLYVCILFPLPELQ